MEYPPLSARIHCCGSLLPDTSIPRLSTGEKPGNPDPASEELNSYASMSGGRKGAGWHVERGLGYRRRLY